MYPNLTCVWTGSKIVFTNGSQDPWRRASKQISSPNSELEFTLIKLDHSILYSCNNL